MGTVAEDKTQQMNIGWWWPAMRAGWKLPLSLWQTIQQTPAQWANWIYIYVHVYI